MSGAIEKTETELNDFPFLIFHLPSPRNAQETNDEWALQQSSTV